jgi:hypothetical protein
MSNEPTIWDQQAQEILEYVRLEYECRIGQLEGRVTQLEQFKDDVKYLILDIDTLSLSEIKQRLQMIQTKSY